MKADALLDAVWPRRCAICAGRADRPGRHVCSGCLMRIPFVDPSSCCRVCGREFAGFRGGGLCEDCSSPRTAPRFDAAASAVRFEGEARRLILDYKFNRAFYLKDDFSDWMRAALEARFPAAEIDAVASVPLSLFHRIDRGFDQCAALAREIAAAAGRRTLGGAIGRKGHPARQAGLDEEARRENVKGTFAVLRPSFVRGRTILLVDDVMTTGSTLSECAAALKDAGAWRVWCLSLARSVRG